VKTLSGHWRGDESDYSNCSWWLSYRDIKSAVRAGPTRRDAKVDKGKERGSVGRAINEVFEKVQITVNSSVGYH